MPPSDSKLCPALTRAMPDDDLPPGSANGYRRVDDMCEVLFGDGRWHDVTLVSWRRDRLKRWVAVLEWHAQGGTWQEAYLYAEGKIRPG